MFEPPQDVTQCSAIDLVRAGGPPYRVTRGDEAQEFDDWDEADAWFRGDLDLIVPRTIEGLRA
jgi:hypothetical protein